MSRARERSGEFRQARYEISCARCGEQHATDEPELLRAGSDTHIDPPAAELFVSRWDPDAGEGWNHRLIGAVDPFDTFMEGLITFVKAHRTHGLAARLIP